MRAQRASVEIHFQKAGFTKGGYAQVISRAEGAQVGIGFRGTVDAVKLAGGRVDAQRLPVCQSTSKREGPRMRPLRPWFRAACYDPFTGHVLMAEAERDPAGWPRFCNVVRLDAANVVTEVIDSAAIRAYLQHYTSTTLAAAASATVASTDPGVAAAAAAAATAAANAGAGFTHILHMASDGQGNVYLVTGDEGRARCAILKLTLPDDWRAGVTSGASVPGAEGSRRSPQHATAHGKRPRHDTASSASTTTSTTSRASETAEVRVSMLLPAAPSTDITGLAWDARSESLLFSTPTAIYRLPQLSSPRGGAAAGGGGVSAATEHEEGEAGARAGGAADGGSAGSGSGNTGSGGAQGPSGAGGQAEGSRQLSQLREAGAAAATAAAAAAVAAVAAGSGVPVAALPSAAAVAAAAIAAIPQPPVMLLVAGKEGERAPASGPDGNPLATGTGTGGGTGGTGGTGDAGGTGGTASGGSEGREVNSSAPGGGDAGDSGREGDASATPALDGRDEDEDEESPDTPPPEVAAADARFSAIGGVCVDADGNIYIIDNGSFYDRHIYKMSCCTNGLLPVVSGWGNTGNILGCPAILDNGVLVACSDPFDNGFDNWQEWDGDERCPEGMLLLVDVGARPPMGHPSAVTCVAAAIAAAAAALGVHAMGGAAAGTFLVGGGGGGGGGSGKSNGNAASRGRRHTPPGVATTGGSGAVASTSASTGRWQPGSADLTIVVGSRSFSVHRGVIAACSGYCRQRLADSGGSTGQLDLPDADADAFALLLRWLYTGATVIPATHAQAVAELADRLLLPPELCRAAQSQVLAAVTPETVVDTLLWAERLGAAASEMLRELKSWYVNHRDLVMDVAAESVRQLEDKSPALARELLEAAAAGAVAAAAEAAGPGSSPKRARVQ
ncbi:hypothetical protein CHLRE_02g101150v5 [Chlamydomonas reinhardtii]|uniref:BTB domain-containing protein n=1 Tax=Chlamydomonas reinhardtii TaxID=3055 RepID=A0A2K3E2B3_CHLRE|nr:uncharacterized protein CHLRE_02g101150v5 [Chlamydomonas reinhardtii]PNW86916.1 hypothetical protein CHLRE_02g101150v5 [Chlamydomonas reinhardtii]